MQQSTEGDAAWADLADLTLGVARELHTTALPDGVIPVVGSEQNVIRFIDHHPGSSPSVVADATGIQRSNLSAALRSLEAKGLIVRRPDPSDARGVQLWPTAAADRNLRLLRHGWSALLGDAAARSGADASTIEATVALLREIEVGLAAKRRSSGSALPAHPA